MPCIGSLFPQVPAENSKSFPTASMLLQKAGVVISKVGVFTSLTILPFLIK